MKHALLIILALLSGDIIPQAMRRVPLDLPSTEVTITVEGDGHGDLDCYLYQGDFKTHDAKFLLRDDSSRDGCQLKLVPEKPGRHLLLIQNASGKVEHYTVSVDG